MLVGITFPVLSSSASYVTIHEPDKLVSVAFRVLVGVGVGVGAGSLLQAVRAMMAKLSMSIFFIMI
jgi:hypothetical protein